MGRTIRDPASQRSLAESGKRVAGRGPPVHLVTVVRSSRSTRFPEISEEPFFTPRTIVTESGEGSTLAAHQAGDIDREAVRREIRDHNGGSCPAPMRAIARARNGACMSLRAGCRRIDVRSHPSSPDKRRDRTSANAVRSPAWSNSRQLPPSRQDRSHPTRALSDPWIGTRPMHSASARCLRAP